MYNKSIFNTYILNVKKGKPSDHFEEQEPPKYFMIPFHIACVRLGYVTVSDMIILYYPA